MIDPPTIIEAVYYLLMKLGSKTKMQLLKLIYLSDKYHLIHYGRTITGDEYFLMEYGPVGSTVKDVLDFHEFALSQNEFEYASRFFEHIDERTRGARADGPSVEKLERLSETDIEALDYAVDHFGNWSAARLSNLTHEYPEWKRYKHLFQCNEVKRQHIRTEDLISTIPNDGIDASSITLETAKEIVTGHFE